MAAQRLVHGFLMLLIGLVLYLSLSATGFAYPYSVAFILQSAALIGILDLSVTCMFVMNGFNLSIGSAAMSSLMLLADAMVTLEMPAVSAVVLSRNAYQPLLGCKNALVSSMKHR